MKIRKMTARFGALDGDVLELTEGLNILYAPNESGKSTWCAFLRAMLFGLSTAQRARDGVKPDKLKYRPWSGAPMSGSMELETRSGPVTLRRWTERDNQPMQAFSATVTGTETPVYGLTAENAGRQLTGMTAEVFERSVFIRQSGMAVKSDPELDRRISAIAASGDEEVSFLEAEKRLKSWQRRRRNGRRGAIPELQAELDETRRTLDAIRERSAAAAAEAAEADALEARREEIRARMNRVRSELRKNTLAELGAARKDVERATAAHAAAEEAAQTVRQELSQTPFGLSGPEEAADSAGRDMERAASLRQRAERTPSERLALLPLIPALAAFVLALALPWRGGFLLGAALLILSVAMWARLGSMRRAGEEMLRTRREILHRLGVASEEDIPAVLEEYDRLWAKKERAELRLETAAAVLEEKRAAQKQREARAVSDLDFVSGDNEAVRLSRELERLDGEIARAREERALAEGQARAMGDPVALESELAEGERRCGELLRQEEALELALETLTQADAELQQRLSPRLAKRAAEYFGKMTGGRYDEITLTRDLSAKARRAGDTVGWELDYLSAGAKDQLYLALRLAVCDLALPEEDPCPVVLDDALVAFDRERMESALRLLRELAETRQVILFTCHTRESEFFADDPGVTKLLLAGAEARRGEDP